MKSHRAEQRRVANALAKAWDMRAVRPGRRMQRCCEDFMAAVNLRTAEVKHCPMHCDVNLCDVCLMHRKRTTIKKARFCLQQTIQSGDIIRHIVLTMPTWHGDIRAGADWLADCLTRFKRSKAWRDKVRASMASFEVTGNAQRGWHWHVHVLSIGRYWQAQCKVPNTSPGMEGQERPADPTWPEFVGPMQEGKPRPRPTWRQSECGCVLQVGDAGRRNAPECRCLMQAWHQATGGEARIVHISAAGASHRHADQDGSGDPIAEAVKYMVKSSELTDAALVDFVVGMRHFQAIRWGGEWLGMNPPDDDPDEPLALVCPDDLWRLSTATIGPVLVRLRGSWAPEPTTAELAAVAAGWALHPFIGAMPQGKARPPPSVVLSEAFAVAAVEHLETASTELSSQTDSYFAQNPHKEAEFSVLSSDVPF